MPKNVIVVMLDSLQFNYLGCYGNTWIKTPNIDRLAREGVLFENNYIEGLPTIPARRSMHCGRFYLPTKGWSALDMDDTTIADLCWGRPIDTALIHDCPMYRLPKFGYSRAFDKVWFFHGHEADHDFYRQDKLIHFKATDFLDQNIIDNVDRIEGASILVPLIDEIESYLKHRQYWRCEEDQNVAKVMKKAGQYLDEVDRNKQFFLWVDSFDPHEPWDPPSVYDPDLKCPYDPDYKGKDMFLPSLGSTAVYTEPQLHHVRMLYAEKVTMVDKWVGCLLGKIKALGLEENTLLLLISDHGEPMGNGEHGHGIMRKCRPWPYEELAHAPMIIRGPGLPAGKRVKGFTQSVDVAPTVTDWLGIGVHPEHQGKSLLPLATGEVDKVRDFAIAGYHRYSASIIIEDYSFIHWTRPAERTNIESAIQIYGVGMAEHASHLKADPGNENVMAKILSMSPQERMKLAATLDGEEQWTCTPGSVAEVPATDQLFDRQADPFQLNNIIDKDKKKANELFGELRQFMAELKTT
jgi:arylsulfatase A-like enzyme